MWLCVVELHHNTVSHPSPHPPSPPTSEQGWETQEAGWEEGRGQASRDWAGGVMQGSGGRGASGEVLVLVIGERQCGKKQGSMAKEIEPGGRTELGEDGVRVAGLEERR